MEITKSKNLFRSYSIQYLLTSAGSPVFDIEADCMVAPDWNSTNNLWKDRIPIGYNEELIKLAFLWTHRASVTSISMTTMDELKSTGLYSHLTNKGLTDEINDDYDLADFRFVQPECHYRTIEDWQQSLLKEGIIN